MVPLMGPGIAQWVEPLASWACFSESHGGGDLGVSSAAAGGLGDLNSQQSVAWLCSADPTAQELPEGPLSHLSLG